MKLLMLLAISIDLFEVGKIPIVGVISTISWLLSVQSSARGAYLGESTGRRFWCSEG